MPPPRLCRAAAIPDTPAQGLPKGELPRAKELIRRALDLPVTRYLHTVKLENGKFDAATVK